MLTARLSRRCAVRWSRSSRPVEVARKLNEAQDLIWSAVEHQNATLKDHTAERLDNAQLADVIEAATLACAFSTSGPLRVREHRGTEEHAMTAAPRP